MYELSDKVARNSDSNDSFQESLSLKVDIINSIGVCNNVVIPLISKIKESFDSCEIPTLDLILNDKVNKLSRQLKELVCWSSSEQQIKIPNFFTDNNINTDDDENKTTIIHTSIISLDNNLMSFVCKESPKISYDQKIEIDQLKKMIMNVLSKEYNEINFSILTRTGINYI